jgi:hypothetical protein
LPYIAQIQSELQSGSQSGIFLIFILNPPLSQEMYSSTLSRHFQVSSILVSVIVQENVHFSIFDTSSSIIS